MVDRYGWSQDTSDEEVLQYLDECGPETPHESQLTIAMANIDEAMSLLWFVAQSLRSTKAEFIQNAYEQKSSSAESSAQVFKILLKVQADTLSIVKEYAAGRWSEQSIAQLPSYPDNVR